VVQGARGHWQSACPRDRPPASTVASGGAELPTKSDQSARMRLSGPRSSKGVKLGACLHDGVSRLEHVEQDAWFRALEGTGSLPAHVIDRVARWYSWRASAVELVDVAFRPFIIAVAMFSLRTSSCATMRPRPVACTTASLASSTSSRTRGSGR
jgi:hypothetical protein